MSRPRKHDKGLPEYVRIRHGSYLYRDSKLCRVDEGEARMYEELAKRKKGGDLNRLPAAVAAYKVDHLKKLTPEVAKEHSRLLSIFADEFEDFGLDQVTSQKITQSIDNLFEGKLSAARHYKARISGFFRWCIAVKGLVEVNPCREVWVEKPLVKKTRWNDGLFWAMRDKLSPMHQCYHDLSFLLYQRTTDVRRLRRAQDLGNVIHFEPSKTVRSSGAEVDIPVTPEIREVLDRAAAISREQKVVCAFVIHTSKGTPFTRSGIHSAYRRADEELHGETPLGLSPKSLLPFAVTSAKKRYSIEQLKVGRAHRSVKTTEGYVQTHEVPVSEVRMVLPPRPRVLDKP